MLCKYNETKRPEMGGGWAAVGRFDAIIQINFVIIYFYKAGG